MSSSSRSYEQPRALDLYCCAGGATRGLQQAGFHVTGVDIEPQPHYCGDVFVQADAVTFLDAHWREFDFVHASPPCQAHSAMKVLTGREYFDWIPATRDALVRTTLPWAIENVERAPLRAPWLLCGTMFGLEVRRHRIFETNFPLPLCSPCNCRLGVVEGRLVSHRNGGRVRAGRRRPPRHLGSDMRRAMHVDWMTVMEARQAIPPAYTEWIGRAALTELGAHKRD